MEGESFTTECLEARLNGDSVANFFEANGQEVTQLVVPNDGESSLQAGEGMAVGEVGTTGIFCGQVKGRPVLTQAERVLKSTLMESQPMFL